MPPPQKTVNKFINKKRINLFKFNEHGYNKKLLKFLKESDYILISIPPQSNKDVVLKRLENF